MLTSESFCKYNNTLFRPVRLDLFR